MKKGRVDCNEKINEGRGGNTPSVPADMKTFKAGEDCPLLPSIPDEISLQVIAPKLSPRDMSVLSLVSPSWHKAIHNRSVYDERVRSHSTETFVVSFRENLTNYGPAYQVYLYSLNDGSRGDLPPVPFEGIPYGCKCIPLDGKIYILGGAMSGQGTGRDSKCWLATREVFMFDLAGQRKWKQCASMQEPRWNFGASVLDGKIYVFGGHNGRTTMCKCEVYDPKGDAWSSIGDMVHARWALQVAAVGEELFVYCGMDSDEDFDYAYHPGKNEWRQLKLFATGDLKNPWLDAFVAQGKLHAVTPNGIDVYDIDTNSWSALHSFLGYSLLGFTGRSGYFRNSFLSRWDSCQQFCRRCQILALGDEILILQNYNNSHRSLHVRSRGFGGKTTEIALEELPGCSLSRDRLNSPAIEFDVCVIQL